MKHNVTDLDGENEPVDFANSIVGNYSIDSFFGNFNAQISPFQPTVKNSEIEKISQTDFSHCINFVDNSVNSYVSYPFWKLYFDGSKYNDGAGAGCILISPDGEKTMLTYRLEFQCTNNIVEYEALIQGLKKSINMNVQDILVFGDS
jgi:hypothetical protein